jgi:hypothetical protein
MPLDDSEGRAQSVLGIAYTILCQTTDTDVVTDFARHTQVLLKDRDRLSVQEFPDFSLYFDTLPLQRKELSPAQRIEFDSAGVALWNQCCVLTDAEDSLQESGSLAKGVSE